ncbi:phenoloxidase 2-like [Ischnura elegans]|uniref:phenoloxidase 2-like n=1 Tax=Ischnura elegans TaxID=197161 RepID=UPI001ED8B098|nr:phenoloxidase 2-like [Ischnura elegans]
MGTVRIFLAPKCDEKGKEMLFIDQKRLFIVLDKFAVIFSGENRIDVIKRESSASSIVAKSPSSFAKMEKLSGDDRKLPRDENFCGCGWPQNLLIPKGKPEGYPCQIFVMISNPTGVRSDDFSECFRRCPEESSYYGARYEKYPDDMAMGFPFDRLAGNGTDKLKEFVEPHANMFVTDVNIVFKGEEKPFSAKEGDTPKDGDEECTQQWKRDSRAASRGYTLGAASVSSRFSPSPRKGEDMEGERKEAPPR